MEQEALYFSENGIIKSVLHKNKKTININEVDIKEIISSHKKSNDKDSFKFFTRYIYKGNVSPLP